MRSTAAAFIVMTGCVCAFPCFGAGRGCRSKNGVDMPHMLKP